MRVRLLVATASVWITFLPAAGSALQAAEVKAFITNQMKTVMEDLGPQFERATGHKLVLTFDGVGAVAKRIQRGEPADVILLPREGIERLVKDGTAVAGDGTVVARSRGLAVVVQEGAPKPDISSPEALKRTLLAARSITYRTQVGGGASSNNFARVLDRLKITEEVNQKSVYYPGGAGAGVGNLVANGGAEIGVHFYHEFLPVRGIDIVGPLPGDLQEASVLSAAIMPRATDAVASKALVDFLRTPEAATVIKANGLDPAIP
jgi:molybdate transport system substrate-binding protein